MRQYWLKFMNLLPIRVLSCVSIHLWFDPSHWDLSLRTKYGVALNIGPLQISIERYLRTIVYHEKYGYCSSYPGVPTFIEVPEEKKAKEPTNEV